MCETIIAGFTGGLTVLVFDILKDLYFRRANERESKYKQIEAWIDSHADLSSLYYMLARRESKWVRDEDGNFLMDKQGQPIVETRVFGPEEEIAEGLRQIEERTVPEAIAVKTVEIRRISNRILDLAVEVDPSGDLKTHLNSLHWQTTNALQFWIKNKNFKGMVEGLKEASEQRRKARETLRKKRRWHALWTTMM
jgi:hypothetical protein